MGELEAQENIGINQDNYAPVNGRFLNPSNIVDSWTWLDINVVGVSTYLRSNFAYIPNAQLTVPSSLTEPVLHQPDKVLYGYSSEMVLGPSVSVVVKKDAFAFHSAVRSYIFTKNLPPETIGFIEDSTSFVVPDGFYEVKRARMKEMTWEEYGFTYGRILKRRNDNMYTGAITVSRLYGLHSAGMYMRHGDLRVDTAGGSFVNVEDGYYWYNEPARMAGKGWSASLGFTYKKAARDISNYIPHSVWGGCSKADYKFKLGISLLDLGAINFNRAAVASTFDEETPIDSMRDWTDATILETANETNNFSWLPAALSVQYDHNFGNFVYGNLALIQRITLPAWKGAERANQLAASIRYERRRFSVAVPLTLHEYQYPQLGLSLRLWFLVLGTDQVLPFIRRQDLYSADLYLYFKIPILTNPNCRGRSQKDEKGRGHYQKVLCPAWQKFE